ncbi:MAG TPA: Ig-like domain-containing protein [Verrucomicrobiae bacterium]
MSLLAVVPFALASAQTAPPTTGLQLWLRADTGVTTNATGAVSQWQDQSGNNNHALQTDDTRQPRVIANALNAKPVLRFDGTDDFLNVTTSPSLDIPGDIASFAVIRVDDYANYNSIWGKTAGANGNIPAPTDFYLIQGNGFPQLYRGDGSAFGNVQAERAVRANSYVVLGFRQAGTEITHYLNGNINGTGEITATPFDAGTDLKIGTREDLFTKLKGDMAELLIYNEALTEAQVNTAMNYLRTKYGIVNAAPTVSITAPANNTTVAAPASVTVTVNASDEDGTITRVNLLADGTVIASATAAPFSFPLRIESVGTVVLTAVATDDRDASTTSSNITLTATGAAPTLNANSSLKLWLRADQGVTLGTDNAVTAWADQSGNNNHATAPSEAEAPTLSSLLGKPALDFDGVDDFFTVADTDSLSITNEMATFAVVRFDDFAGFRAIWGKTLEGQPRPTDYYLTSGSGIPTAFRGYTTNDTQNVNAGVSGAGRIPTNTPVVLGFQQAGATLTHYRNGSPFGSGPSLVAADADTPLLIGTRDNFQTRMKGELAELLIYDGALSSNDLANVTQYLGAKYGLAVVQVINAAPVVQLTSPAGGTSIAAGGTVTVNATATDADGSIVRVEFFANGAPFASDTGSPYSGSVKLNTGGSVALTAVATDNRGLSTTSAVVNITVTGGETPAIPANGLALWLRPDRGVNTNASGAVTLWEDWSGNVNNARQVDPAKAPMLVPSALNGQPVLDFDGTDDFLEVGHSPSLIINGDITTLFVVNFDDHAFYQAVWAKTGGGGGNIPAANDYYLVPNSGIPRYYRGNPAGAIGFVDGTEAVPAGQYVIAGFGYSGITATHYLGAAENGALELDRPGGDSGTPLRIGTRGDSFTKLKGTLAEVIIYNRALPEAERLQLVSYLQTKYGLGGSVPTGPTLSVTRSNPTTLIFSWPESEQGFVLESSLTLAADSWTVVTEPVIPSGGQNTVTVQSSGPARFFRLSKP